MKHYNQVTTFTEIQVYSDKASDKFAQYQLHVTAYTINQSGSVVIFLSRFKSFTPKESTHTSVSLIFFYTDHAPWVSSKRHAGASGHVLRRPRLLGRQNGCTVLTGQSTQHSTPERDPKLESRRLHYRKRCLSTSLYRHSEFTLKI